MSKDLIKNENYQGWRIEIYKRVGGNRFEYSCYNPKGENVDHLKNPDPAVIVFREIFALEDAKAFIDRLISEGHK